MIGLRRDCRLADHPVQFGNITPTQHTSFDVLIHTAFVAEWKVDTRPTWLLCTATFSVFSPSTVQLRQCKIPSLREKMAVAGTGSGFRSVSSTSSARSVTPKTCTALLKEKPCDAGTFALRAPGRTHHDHMTNLVAVLMGEPAAQQAAEAPADEGQLLVVTLRKAHHRSESPSRTLSVIPNGRPTRTPWT